MCSGQRCEMLWKIACLHSFSYLKFCNGYLFPWSNGISFVGRHLCKYSFCSQQKHPIVIAKTPHPDWASIKDDQFVMTSDNLGGN